MKTIEHITCTTVRPKKSGQDRSHPASALGGLFGDPTKAKENPASTKAAPNLLHHTKKMTITKPYR